ncbi:MAG: M48 family metallopeptidase [Polaromonas sp.]
MQRLLQLTLDFFESAPAVTASHPAGVDKSPLASAPFTHPSATRQALLNGVVVGYAFRRGKRRSIGFSVCADGLAVSAPKWVPLHEIDKAVLEKSGWILKKLQETRQRHARLESARIDWKDGATLPFLGEPVTVVLDSRLGATAMNPLAVSANAQLHTNTQALPGQPRLTLRLSLPQGAAPERIRDAAQAWLMRQARQIFTGRLEHFAPLLGVRWRKLSLSSAGTRWGSASADGAIRLNWRLVHFKLPVLDYVVAHELSHLRVMNHSPRFWDTVREVVPDYAQLRGQLRDDAIPRW